MARSVFISYAHTANQVHAEALSANLGDLAFLDVAQIEDGDPFPQQLLDNLLDASVVVIFVSKAYSERPVCRLEMRLALAGDPSPSNLVLAMGEGARSVLDLLPQAIADQNCPPADATERLEALVRRRLAANPSSLRQRLSDTEVQKLKVAFLNESNMLDPQPLSGIVSLPEGILGSIDSRFMGRGTDLRHIHEVLAQGSGDRLVGRVTAAGGFGKTRLAIEYLYRYGPRYYPG